MPGKLFIRPGVVLGLLTLILMFTVAFRATANAANANTSTTRASYAFTALITSGEHNGTPVTGGLTLRTQSANGNVSGSFHAPDSAAVPVQAQITGNQITIVFHHAIDDRVIRGTGTASSSGEYLGSFIVLATDDQKQVASGVWSALPVVNPESVLAFALISAITQGPDKGTVFTAAVVIDSKSLQGTFSGPNGDLAPVSVVFKDEGEKIIASYAGGLFIDTGHLVDDPDGYVGTVVVAGSTDRGHWTGYFFTF